MKSDAIFYFLIVVTALASAMLAPSLFVPLAPLSTHVLGTIFLITAVQLRLRDIFSHVTEMRMIVVVSIWLLVALPLLVYAVSVRVLPEYAIALLLLSAMPAGMTAPLLTKIAGGKEEFSLVIAVVTSLLAPLSIPVVTLLTIGTRVPVDVVSIALSLVYIIVIPFILGGLITYVWPTARLVSQKLHPLSLLLLGVLIASLVSEQSGVIREQVMSGSVLRTLTVLVVFFALLHIVGYVLSRLGNQSLHIASIVSLVYMNFTLAIYLAYTFFPEPQVVVPTTLSIIPWALFLVPFTVMYRSVHKE